MVPQLLNMYILLLIIPATVSTSVDRSTHFFSKSLIQGTYGRIFEYTQTPNSDPCPQTILHLSAGFQNAVSDGWTIPHNKIKHNNALCADSTALVLRSFNSSSSIPNNVNKDVRIAVETFEILKNQTTGFWMGIDARSCGRFLLPHPTYIFFVKERKRNIMTPFRVSLAPKVKYMFVISSTFTCVYGGARQTVSPSPSVSPSPTISLSSSPSFSPSYSTSPLSSEFAVESPEYNPTEESPSPGISISGEALCFPGSALVRVHTTTNDLGRIKKVKDLSIGDVVSIGSGQHSEIHAFSHYNQHAWSEFVAIRTGCGAKIVLTSGHFLYVNGKLIEARHVRPGDMTQLSNGSTCDVTKIEKEWHQGLFNPHTLHGDLVVNGILTSCYTSFVKVESAHGLLAPLRGVWKVLRLAQNKRFDSAMKLPQTFLADIWRVLLNQKLP